MDISVFSHDFCEYSEGIPFDIRVSGINGFVYLYYNCLTDLDISFFSRYGLSLLRVSGTDREGFCLEVCLVPNI